MELTSTRDTNLGVGVTAGISEIEREARSQAEFRLRSPVHHLCLLHRLDSNFFLIRQNTAEIIRLDLRDNLLRSTLASDHRQGQEQN